MKPLLFASIAILVLVGCAATGPAIESQQLAVLQKVNSNLNDVVLQFGKPSVNSKNIDGTRTAIYLQPGDDEPGAIVSLATVIAGASVTRRESVTFEFDEKDVLMEYRWRRASSSAVQPVADATPASAAAMHPAQSGAVGATPCPAVAPTILRRRNDGLPGWLPRGNDDPRDPFK